MKSDTLTSRQAGYTCTIQKFWSVSTQLTGNFNVIVSPNKNSDSCELYDLVVVSPIARMSFFKIINIIQST